MALDGKETLVGAEVRDQQARPVKMVVSKHTPLLSTDVLRGYQPADQDGREHIVIQDRAGNDFAVAVPVVVPASSNKLPTIYVPPPTGNANTDTANIQTAINQAIVGSAIDSRTPPMSRTAALADIRLATGIYAINAKLKIYAVDGLRVEGSGPLATQLTYQGNGVIDKLLDIQGCQVCMFANFGLNGGSSSVNYPQTALNVDAISTVANNSSQGVHFFNIYVQGSWVTGIAYGASGANNSADVFRHLFTNVFVLGNQAVPGWNTATLWQVGWQLGGVGFSAANVLSPTCVNCEVGLCVTGIRHSGVGVGWYGGAFEANGTDVLVSSFGVGEPLKYSRVRGEGSGALINSASAGGANTATFEDIGWLTHIGYYPSQSVITYLGGGVLRLRNVVVTSDSNDTAANLGVTLGGNTIADISNLLAQRNDQAADSSVWLNANGGKYTIRHFGAIKTDGSGTVGSTLISPVSSGDYTATAANYTVTSDRVVAVTSTAAPRTITLPDVNKLRPGYSVVVKDESGGAATNNITITTVLGETFEGGGTTKVINTNFGYFRLYSNGSQWFIVT